MLSYELAFASKGMGPSTLKETVSVSIGKESHEALLALGIVWEDYLNNICKHDDGDMMPLSPHTLLYVQKVFLMLQLMTNLPEEEFEENEFDVMAIKKKVFNRMDKKYGHLKGGKDATAPDDDANKQ